MLVHGILLACLFAPMHECSHGTAFRTRRLNEAVYWFVSLVYIIQPTWYRYRHAVHHTYTQIQGKDPAMVLPSPTTWQHYFEQLLGWRFWTTFPVVITKHAFGHMRPQDSWYVPKKDLPRIYNEARIMLAVTAWSPAPRSISAASRRWSTGCFRASWASRCSGPGASRNTRVATKARTCAPTRARPRPACRCAAVLEHAVPLGAPCLPQAPFFALPEFNRLVGHQLKPMGESLWAVDKEVRRSCIVSPEQARRIVDERKRRKESVDKSWLCHLIKS